MAEGFLRSVLQRRFGAEAPTVASAGTLGWEGSPAQPESIVAAGEREVDIEDHRRHAVRAREPRSDLFEPVAPACHEHEIPPVGRQPVRKRLADSRRAPRHHRQTRHLRPPTADTVPKGTVMAMSSYGRP